jgi:hypothetical protein
MHPRFPPGITVILIGKTRQTLIDVLIPLLPVQPHAECRQQLLGVHWLCQIL